MQARVRESLGHEDAAFCLLDTRPLPTGLFVALLDESVDLTHELVLSLRTAAEGHDWTVEVRGSFDAACGEVETPADVVERVVAWLDARGGEADWVWSLLGGEMRRAS